MTIYKVKSSLVFESHYGDIDFKGCEGWIVNQTESYFFVQFYAGLPFMLSKSEFMGSVIEMNEKTDIGNMEVRDISLWSGNKQIKRFRTLISPGDTELTQVKKNAFTWFKLTEGAHYDRITTELINQVSNNSNTTTEMPRTKATTPVTPLTPPQTEATKSLMHIEKVAETITVLPELQPEFTLGGVVISPKLIAKEVEAIKKIKLKSETDSETYELLKQKAKELQKTRTSTTKFREDTARVVNTWLKKFKATVEDDIKAALLPGEEHCEAQIAIYDNWAIEQERIRQEQLLQQVESRTRDLQSVQGILNRDSLHWTFSHSPSQLVENSFLETADDSEWNGLMAELEKSLQAENLRLQQEKQELENARSAVFNTRIQMLQLVGGYENPQQGVYTKNGHTLTDEQIRTTSDADWMPLVLSHNTPKNVVNPFATAASPATEAPQQTQSAPVPSGSFNPFAQFAQSIEQPAQEQPQTVAPAEGTPEYEQLHSVPHTIWDKVFVEQQLGKTTLRVFPVEHQADAAKVLGEMVYDGRWDNGLMFIIYKNGK